MERLDTPNVFLENLAGLHAISTTPSGRVLKVGGSVMARPTKREVLDAASSAFVVSERLNDIARDFINKAEKALNELIAEKDKNSTNADKLFDLDKKIKWALLQTEAYRSAAKSYLKEGKRLTRRARWLRG